MFLPIKKNHQFPNLLPCFLVFSFINSRLRHSTHLVVSLLFLFYFYFLSLLLFFHFLSTTLRHLFSLSPVPPRHENHRFRCPGRPLLPLTQTVIAQGYFGGDEYASSGDDFHFCYVGCFDSSLINSADTTFVFNIRPHISSDPQRNDRNPFPDYVQGTYYNNTVTPYSCAQACRGYGYAFSAMASNECFCSPLAPPSGTPTSIACSEPCDGDASQTCGGAQTGPGPQSMGAAQVYGDPSFVNPSVLDNASPGGLDYFYKYLGCYFEPNFGPTGAQGNGVLASCQATYADCLSHCSANGYPLAGVEYSRSGSQTSVCK
jgi:hypothetical protein